MLLLSRARSGWGMRGLRLQQDRPVRMTQRAPSLPVAATAAAKTLAACGGGAEPSVTATRDWPLRSPSCTKARSAGGSCSRERCGSSAKALSSKRGKPVSCSWGGQSGAEANQAGKRPTAEEHRNQRWYTRLVGARRSPCLRAGRSKP